RVGLVGSERYAIRRAGALAEDLDRSMVAAPWIVDDGYVVAVVVVEVGDGSASWRAGIDCADERCADAVVERVVENVQTGKQRVRGVDRVRADITYDDVDAAGLVEVSDGQR